MSNMSYCRFENTLGDLQDCHSALGDGQEELSSAQEKRARESLLVLCKRIADEFEDEIEEIVETRKREREARVAERVAAREAEQALVRKAIG